MSFVEHGSQLHVTNLNCEILTYGANNALHVVYMFFTA